MKIHVKFQSVFLDGLIGLSENKIEHSIRVSVSISREYLCTGYQDFSESAEIFLAVAQKAIFKYEGQRYSNEFSFVLLWRGT